MKRVPRSGVAIAAQHRHVSKMKHRNTPRGGARNVQADLRDEADQEPDMKLNKQGVRDLSYIEKRRAGMTQKQITDEVRPTFGKNEMPGELASALLVKQSEVADYGPPLSPEATELLVLLAEECGEVVQRVTKILRFGVRDNPWDGKSNKARLADELGDIQAIVTCLQFLHLVYYPDVYDAMRRKLAAFVTEEDPTRPRLRHMTETLRGHLRYVLDKEQKVKIMPEMRKAVAEAIWNLETGADLSDPAVIDPIVLAILG